jgi:archaellum component FlaF (FlaF/FlaG flagellin family)
MGLSVAISGGIILTVFILILFSLPGLADKMFSIGDTTTQVTQHEQEISNTKISMDHLSVLVGSSKVNFTLNNDGSEKLWNFIDFNLFIQYNGTISKVRTQQLSYSGSCLGLAPAAGNWCIQSITNDITDPGIINAGEAATIWTQVSENLATNLAVITMTTDNGVVSTVSTTTCGSFCYQMIWDAQADQASNPWANPLAVTEFDGGVLFRTKIDLSDMTQWRLFDTTTNGNGLVTCILGAQYSTDNAVTWRALDNGTIGAGSAANNSCDLTGDFITPWTPLNSTAQSDVFVRVEGSGGNGVANPGFGRIQLQFRS